MLGIISIIVDHHIDTWHDVLHVRQKQCPIHLREHATIQAKVEKLEKTLFIFSIPYTIRVSNPILVNKKQGNLLVYTNFRELNKAFPKDIYPTPFINQVINA
jgi:hypothetical protein